MTENSNNTLRIFLFPLAILYGALIFIRNTFYQIGFFVSRALPVSVISVGNITTGGTGKTPTVMALANWLQEEGRAVAILSRGYQRRSSGTQIVSKGSGLLLEWKDCGDEPAMIAQLTHGIPVVVDENRYRGGLKLIREFHPDVIILDDGFQHRAIRRNVDIVLVNAGDTVQGHKLLPAGILREPWRGIHRADCVALTKTDVYSPKPFLVNRLKRMKQPYHTLGMTNKLNLVHGVDNDGPYIMVCAIGDPDALRLALEQKKFTLSKSMVFPDHYAFTEKDVLTIETAIKTSQSSGIICTAKDWVKLSELNPPFPVSIFSLEVDISPEIKKIISEKLAQPSRPV